MKRINITPKIKNKYEIQLRDSKTGSLKQEIHFHNHVTDYWKENIMGKFRTSSSSKSFAIALGTGEGIHTSADTQLFHQIYNQTLNHYNYRVYHVKGNPYISYKFSLTLDESKAKGTLTEIALAFSASSSTLTDIYTIANFQDAEGHPIAIEKTDTDTLVLNIELELSLDTSALPSNVLINLWYREDNGQSPMIPTKTNISAIPTQDITPVSMLSDYFYCSLLNWMFILTSSTGLSLNTDKSMGYLSNAVPIKKTSGTWSRSEVDGRYIYRVSFSDVAKSAEGNLTDATEPYQIMSLGFLIGGVSISVNLPDHDIFPPTELEFKITGDGVTTDFNLPVPILMRDRGCVVTINNQIIPQTDYDWYGKNYQTIQAWELNDWSKVTNYSIYSAGYRGIVTSPYLYDFGLGNDYINYDFLEPKTVDCVCRLSTTGTSGKTSIYYKITESDDWTLVKEWASSDTAIGIERLSTPITARYWRVEPNVRGTSKIASQKTGFPLFGQYDEVTKPTIRFHNPPAADQVVLIKAWTEYPIKTEDWVYKTISLDICKGAGD